MGTVQLQRIPAPLTVDCHGDADGLLSREWLLTNRLGAYSSSTVLGCNTRRYHALLTAATCPPMGRIAALSTVMEQLVLRGKTYELATNEFPGCLSPRGLEHLDRFVNDAAATFVYRIGKAELTKQVLLAEDANAVLVRYILRGGEGVLRLRPFAAMRDFHSLRVASQPAPMTYEIVPGGMVVKCLAPPNYALHLLGWGADCQADPQWWYKFLYREDIARGQDGSEDLYTPGSFVWELAEGQSCVFSAGLGEAAPGDFDGILRRARQRQEELLAHLPAGADETTRRLAIASDAFIARRSFRGSAPAATILAGFPWFADWGRDAFIALPGLLIATGRFSLARQVFKTFADALSEGMIPNRFDDYAPMAHYNSMDASLWFIVAAGRYMAATDDWDFWRDTLMPAAGAIMRAYHDGTRFGIHADADGLLSGGSQATQLTWMDVALGSQAVTPRHGKPVEVNALWHAAHWIMSQLCRRFDAAAAQHYADRAAMIGPAFVRTFWNDQAGCLFDCVNEAGPDASIRPNQILAVSLPHSPLSADQQAAVLRRVSDDLLTPLGLRTLAPHDPRYRRQYGGSWESRDRAYHQGTAWAWLIGPYVEALLRVQGATPLSIARARQCLAAFDEHLLQAGLGTISEIFDADAPHAPRGCFAQAWSVGEVIRAKLLIDQHANTAETK